MGMLTREAILAVQDLPTQDVEVPEWGGTVRVRGLTAKERDEYEMSIYWEKDNTSLLAVDIRSKLVEQCVVDEEGKRMFASGELRSRSGVVVNRLFTIARELSGIGVDVAADLGKG